MHENYCNTQKSNKKKRKYIYVILNENNEYMEKFTDSPHSARNILKKGIYIYIYIYLREIILKQKSFNH